jgi:clan AA aspartic protease (TIGR02281 family)
MAAGILRHILLAGIATLTLTGCQPPAPLPPQRNYASETWREHHNDAGNCVTNTAGEKTCNVPQQAATPPPAPPPYQPRDLCEEGQSALLCAPTPAPPDAAPQSTDASPMPPADAAPEPPPIPDPTPPVALPPPPVETPHSASIALQREANGSFLVPVSVDDAPSTNFLIDSGASKIVLPHWLVVNLMAAGKLTEADYLGKGTAVLADGSAVSSYHFRLATVQIGNLLMHDVEGVTTGGDAIPLLGLSALNKFSSWAIDPRASKLNVTWD